MEGQVSLVEVAGPVAGAVAESILKKYLETRYVSKNPDLLRIVGELEASQVTRNEQLYSYLKGNQWREFDAYVKSNLGKDNFFRIFQQIFMFYYFLPEGEKITRKQFQNAMGIQQVRWMAEEDNLATGENTREARETAKREYENLVRNIKASKVPTKAQSNNLQRKKRVLWPYTPFVSALYKTIPLIKLVPSKISSLEICLWEDIPNLYENMQRIITDEIFSYFKRDKRGAGDNTQTRIYIDNIINTLLEKFRGSIWYNFKTDPDDMAPIHGWEGFGIASTHDRLYPIPETLNFSSLASVYCPTLIFGSLSDKTLFKFSVSNRKRPYAAHFPGAANLYDIHNHKQYIVRNWMHDFTHQSHSIRELLLQEESQLPMTQQVINYSFKKLNETCLSLAQINPGLTPENLDEQLSNPGSPLNRCLDENTLYFNQGGKNFFNTNLQDRLSKSTGINSEEVRPNNFRDEPTNGEEIARIFNDNGLLLNDPFIPEEPEARGGGRYKKGKTRKLRRKSKRTRRH